MKWKKGKRKDDCLEKLKKKIRNKKRWERGEKFNGRNEQVKI